MRGFADRAARRSALERFYGGPVWAEHAPAARATMVNTADALLLRPAAGGPLAPPPGCRFHTRCPYVMPVCKIEAPELKQIAAGRIAACHLNDK